MIIHTIILVSACAGFVVTVLFVRSLRAEKSCGMRGTCTIVAETQQARFLKIRNTTVGFIFYAALAAVEIARLALGNLPPLVSIYEETAIWIAAGMSFYLLYQLVFVLKMRCPLCFTAHCINGFMAVCLVVGK